MITQDQCKGALTRLLSPRKEIFFFTNQQQVGQNDFFHAIYFFTISDDRLFNISPLLTTLAGIKATETNRITHRAPGDWPIQLVNVLKQKLEDPDVKFLTLDDALPSTTMRLLIDSSPIRLVPNLNEDIDPNDPF
jgi:hypothetical protein